MLMSVEQTLKKSVTISKRQTSKKSPKKKLKDVCRFLILTKIPSEFENCALLVGDLIVFLPQQEAVFKVNSSFLNKFKNITSLTYNKNLQLIEVNVARKNGVPDKSLELVVKLRSMGDKNYYTLSNYIEAWIQHAKNQNNSGNKQPQSSDMKYQDLLFQPVQNYRHNLEQIFSSYMRDTLEIAQYIQRYYYNPITKEVILYSCSYSKELIKLLGQNKEIMLSKLQKYGIIDFLHPTSVVRFMYYCFHDFFNDLTDSFIKDIDLITIEGYKVPCNVFRSFIQGAPNEVLQNF